MIKFNARINWKIKKVQDAVKKGEIASLYRAAAYVRGVVKRKLRRRKHKVSPPGSPPFVHASGGRDFKRSIVFAVDKKEVAAYIGPQRMISQTNSEGKPAPNVLEFGGKSTPGHNAAWFRKKNVGPLKNKNQVAAYFRSAGFGPVYMSTARNSIASGKSAAQQKDLKRRIKSKFSHYVKKKIYYVDLKIQSEKMAFRAAENTIQFFGYPYVPAGNIEPRPFMGPSLNDAKSALAQFFRNSVKSA